MLRKRLYFASLFLVLLIAFPCKVALATPSFLGPSGLILTPDGQITHFQSFSFSAHFFDLSGSLKEFGLDGSTNAFAINYSPVPAIELGFTSLDSSKSDRANMLNGKVVLIPESEIQPFSLTLGVIDLLDEQEVSPYFLLSKSLNLSGPRAKNQIALLVNAGYGGGFFHDGLVIGSEIKLTPQFSLLAEGTKEYINLGVRFTSQGLGLDIGFIDTQDLAGGISYSFYWK